MRSQVLCLTLCLISCASWAQTTTSIPSIGAAGYSQPFPLQVAPGELLTLFVQNAPVGSNVTAVFWNGADQPMPVIRIDAVTANCGQFVASACAVASLAVTVQLPFEIQTVCNICANPVQPSGSIALIVNGVKTAYVPVQPLQDHVHILTACDVLVAGGSVPPGFGGAPCFPSVMHADGTPVSSSRPAQSGEELVAYAVGLGQTDPPLTTGQPAAASGATLTKFLLDFNYHPNAQASRPLAASVTGFAPLFTGATQGFIGLYQVNFVVPPPPAGLLPCVLSSGTLINGNIVQSNLTVSIGSVFSFDGAGICVQTPAVGQGGS